MVAEKPDHHARCISPWRSHSKAPADPSPLMCYFTLGACDCLKASAPLFRSFPTWLGGVGGGREGRGRGFAPRSVFSKCLWSNQVPRHRRRRRRRTELIAGKVFLTFASNHSSLLISIIYFSLPLHILPLTNLFHQLFSFFFSLPSLLAFLSQRVSCLILSKTVQRLHLMLVSLGTLGKRNYRGIKENVSVLEWHLVE